MASLERLRRNRGVVRASVTRTITLLTDELQATAPDAAQVDSHVTYLTQKNVELGNLNKQILDATDDDAYDEELEAAEDYDRKVSYAVSRARFFLREHANTATARRTSRPEATLPNPDVAGAGSSAHAEVTDAAPRVTEGTPGPATAPRHRTVVLPKLQIPTFSGALRDWQTFWDHFSATIHRNEDLLPIEKFKYLLSYLSGAAKRAIEGIRLTEDNYAIAIRTLTERFGRRDLLINEHIDHLLALPPVKSSADVDKLRLLYDKVQFRVSALTGLGVSPDQYNVVLNRVLMRCLPDDLAILYRQKYKEAAQDTSGIATPEERARQVAEMLSFLRIQIEVREEDRPGRTPSAFSRFLPDEDVEPPSAPMGHLPTASALAAESVPITEEVCRLCSSCQHTIADCNVQLSAEEKRARLRTARCCYRCGLQNHMARFCRRARSIICSKCNRRHLTILCELFTPVAPTRAIATTVNQDEPRITGRGTNTPSVTSAPSALSGINAVLLQTGRVWIECGSQKRLVRILLDSGSQRTFIRADVSKDLRCPVIGTEELSVVTFGHSKPREVIRSRRVALTLRGQRRDIAVTVEALEVPEVCAVTSPPLSTDILQLLCDKNYDAADNFHPDTWHPQEVSVLLGSDVYWKVATGKVDHLTSNLTAVETKFGWTVQGTTERERSSAFPRCDRGGPPSQRRPFFRGCALQTARPPRYPRVLQGGSGGGFEGSSGSSQRLRSPAALPRQQRHVFARLRPHEVRRLPRRRRRWTAFSAGSYSTGQTSVETAWPVGHTADATERLERELEDAHVSRRTQF
ncbi:uncharacterized protein LOC119378295 [Rhipicephalus sanguineus]|uniref:uncharacterized protein LOC119378295 n=1 Tax=Rhipicephalus sanguineus TaxID=34632 RepID=UPI0018959D03|nr:uncharacterized protein LOC119378295 [Rhipicephalus sanguineus]